MSSILPPGGEEDWHLVLRLSFYTDRARLSGFSYTLSRGRTSRHQDVFKPLMLPPPTHEWDVVQALSCGVDFLAGDVWPHYRAPAD